MKINFPGVFRRKESLFSLQSPPTSSIVTTLGMSRPNDVCKGKIEVDFKGNSIFS